jgi:hypothetical protein
VLVDYREDNWLSIGLVITYLLIIELNFFWVKSLPYLLSNI